MFRQSEAHEAHLLEEPMVPGACQRELPAGRENHARVVGMRRGGERDVRSAACCCEC